MMPREVMKMIGDLSNYTLYIVWIYKNNEDHSLVGIFNNLNDAVDTLVSFIRTDYYKGHHEYHGYKDGWLYKFIDNGIEINDLYIEEFHINTKKNPNNKMVRYHLAKENKDSNNFRLIKCNNRYLMVNYDYAYLLEDKHSGLIIDFNWIPTEKCNRFDWKLIPEPLV
jgi:hypothetical protein